jgi:hypothetical protein
MANLSVGSSPFPWAGAAGLAAGPLLGMLFPEAFGGKKQYEGLDPEKYREDIIIGENDLSQIRNVLLQSIQGGVVNPAIRNIKQTGAAGRLPKGATQSAMSGAVSAGSRALASAEPGLQQQKRQSIMDFVNLKRQYLSDKNLYDLGQTQIGSSMLQGSLGGLSKLLMLWQGGLFDRKGQPGYKTDISSPYIDPDQFNFTD